MRAHYCPPGNKETKHAFEMQAWNQVMLGCLLQFPLLHRFGPYCLRVPQLLVYHTCFLCARFGRITKTYSFLFCSAKLFFSLLLFYYQLFSQHVDGDPPLQRTRVTLHCFQFWCRSKVLCEITIHTTCSVPFSPLPLLCQYIQNILLGTTIQLVLKGITKDLQRLVKN